MISQTDFEAFNNSLQNRASFELSFTANFRNNVILTTRIPFTHPFFSKREATFSLGIFDLSLASHLLAKGTPLLLGTLLWSRVLPISDNIRIFPSAQFTSFKEVSELLPFQNLYFDLLRQLSELDSIFGKTVD